MILIFLLIPSYLEKGKRKFVEDDPIEDDNDNGMKSFMYLYLYFIP